MHQYLNPKPQTLNIVYLCINTYTSYTHTASELRLQALDIGLLVSLGHALPLSPYVPRFGKFLIKPLSLARSLARSLFNALHSPIVFYLNSTHSL